MADVGVQEGEGAGFTNSSTDGVRKGQKKEKQFHVDKPTHSNILPHPTHSNQDSLVYLPS